MVQHQKNTENGRKKKIHRFNRLVTFLVEFPSCFIYLVFVTYLCSLCIF